MMSGRACEASGVMKTPGSSADAVPLLNVTLKNFEVSFGLRPRPALKAVTAVKALAMASSLKAYGQLPVSTFCFSHRYHSSAPASMYAPCLSRLLRGTTEIIRLSACGKARSGWDAK